MAFEVQLAVYDLSHGMARQISAQFLGPQFVVDIIPHTALVVFGREYFFGGGIQHEDPNQLRQMMGMRPVQTLSLGRTSVSQNQFEAWCQSCTQNGRYTAASYDLLKRNCNNFSHDAAQEGLKLGQGVPEWILDVPRKFLSSPMGQMVRPMLENMQMGAGGGGGMGMGGAAPFANATINSFSASPPPPAAAVPMVNPWANMSAPKSKQAEDIKPKAQTAPKSTPILDSFCKALLSEEYKTIALCTKKISSSFEDTADQEVLQSLGQTLTNTEKLKSQEVKQVTQLILSKILQPAKPVVTFALMLLRVVILQSTGEEDSAKGCLEWIESQLSNKEAGAPLSTHAARSMAWLTLANAASLSWWTVPETLIEAAFVDWTLDSQPRPEVRQAAAAFCYNKVLLPTATADDKLSDDRVSLLCASLESIVEEPDATTRLRRLLVAARILVPKNSRDWVVLNAKSLMQDLGFPEAIKELQTKAVTGGDAQKCQGLAAEVLGLLQG